MQKFAYSVEFLRHNDNVHMFSSFPNGAALMDEDYIIPGGWHSARLISISSLLSACFQTRVCLIKWASVETGEAIIGVKLAAIVNRQTTPRYFIAGEMCDQLFVVSLLTDTLVSNDTLGHSTVKHTPLKVLHQRHLLSFPETHFLLKMVCMHIFVTFETKHGWRWSL